MSLFKCLNGFLITIVTSFYFFPFTLRFLPGVNTKMFLAGIGVVLCGINIAKGRAAKIDRSLFSLSVAAIFVSVAAFLSVTINNTNDYTYASYIISMWVWLGGAYTVVQLMKWMYGQVTVAMVCKFLIMVCFMQCVLALIIDANAGFKMFVDSVVADLGFVQMDKLDTSNRLYGIGCSLDVAGTRFAAILAAIPLLTIKAISEDDTKCIWGYIISFVFITIIGNMISRTSTIGVLVAFFIWGVYIFRPSYSQYVRGLWSRMTVVVIIAIVISIVLYNNSEVFRSNIRFAFEGFFSLFETGVWETNSNNMLKEMFVLPDNTHTWLIGDGYMYDPAGVNPYYVGDNYPGYYMNTDVGYLRFIFYFGIIGLSAIICYFVVITRLLVNKFCDYKMVFYTFLLINLIVWIKVSTDIFPVFAIFLCVPNAIGGNEDDSKQYENSLSDPLDI